MIPLTILILEDNPDKLNEILEAVSFFSSSDKIITVDTLIDAKKMLLERIFDIFICDIQTPLRNDSEPQSDSGIKLIKELRTNDKFNMPEKTIVMTEYKELFSKFKEDLDRKLISCIHYERKNLSWQNMLIETLKESNLRKKTKLRNKRKIVVFSIHGFNTRGDWKNRFGRILSEDLDEEVKFIYVPWDYGQFKYKIIFPWSRKKRIEQFHKFYNENCKNHDESNTKFCIIAHSFGSYIVAYALRRFPDIKFNNVIFLGSPIKKNFNWDELSRKITKLLFYKGKSDRALMIAPFIGLGNSGLKGFNKTPEFIEYREYEKLEHSDMFGEKHMKDVWIPFLKE